MLKEKVTFFQLRATFWLSDELEWLLPEQSLKVSQLKIWMPHTANFLFAKQDNPDFTEIISRFTDFQHAGVTSDDSAPISD